MEVLQSTAKLQQAQMGTAKAASTETPAAQSVQQSQKVQISQDKVSEAKATNISSQKEMDALVEQLNRSLDPFSTSLRFGYDDSFYVSVIDTKTNDMVRRFPAEEAQLILPKIQEINGLLFDRTV